MKLYTDLAQKKRDKQEAKRQIKKERKEAVDQSICDLVNVVKEAVTKQPQNDHAAKGNALALVVEIWDLLE